MKIILLLLVTLILYPFGAMSSEVRTSPINFLGNPSYIVVVHTRNMINKVLRFARMVDGQIIINTKT